MVLAGLVAAETSNRSRSIVHKPGFACIRARKTEVIRANALPNRELLMTIRRKRGNPNREARDSIGDFVARPASDCIGANRDAEFAGLDGFVEQVRADWKVPGIAVAIVKDGKIVYAKGYGQRYVKRGLPVTPDTLFAIGSCSKAFTAAALGILADDKTLEWDKPLRTYAGPGRRQGHVPDEQGRRD
jgi:CubicO group peptidase (beta-lactamase class C family)